MPRPALPNFTTQAAADYKAGIDREFELSTQVTDHFKVITAGGQSVMSLPWTSYVGQNSSALSTKTPIPNTNTSTYTVNFRFTGYQKTFDGYTIDLSDYRGNLRAVLLINPTNPLVPAVTLTSSNIELNDGTAITTIAQFKNIGNDMLITFADFQIGEQTFVGRTIERGVATPQSDADFRQARRARVGDIYLLALVLVPDGEGAIIQSDIFNINSIRYAQHELS